MSAKGGKKKRRAKNTTAFVPPFTEPLDGQYFGKAIKALGSNKVQLEVYFYTIENKGKFNEKISFKKDIVIGNVRGSMRRREYVNPGSIVLVSEREFNKTSKIVDIILLYKNYHIGQIKNHKLVPRDIVFSDKEQEGDVTFDLSDDEDDIDINNLGYTNTRKTVKKKSNNDDYMSEIGLPSVNFNESDDNTHLSANKELECDEFGNYI